MRTTAFVVGIACCLAGCQTHLEVRKDGTGPYAARSDDRYRAGADYGLPMLQFKLNVKRTLVSCEKDGAVDIRLLTKVTAEPHYVVGERFVVNYPALTSWSKVSGFELQTYDSGVLKSVNAEVEDQTAAIIGDVVKTGIGLLSLSSGVPQSGFQAQLAGSAVTSHQCKQKTKELLARIQAMATDLDAKSEALVKLTDEIAGLEYAASMQALTEVNKQRWPAARKALGEQAKRVAAAQGALDTQVDAASASEQRIWPLKVDEFDLDGAPNPVSQKKLYLLLEEVKDASKPGISQAQLTEALALRAALVAMTEHNGNSCSQSAAVGGATELKDHHAEGLIYRSPVAARLLVCQTADAESCRAEGSTAAIVSTNVLVPQLGCLRMLPMANGAFQNNALKASFRENGSVASFTYDEKVARGKALSGTALAAVNDVLGYRDARTADKAKKADQAKADEAAKKQAVLDELDAEIARLDKLKKISALNEESVRTADGADVQAETARLNAQIALLEARRKLKDAEGALASAGKP